MIPRWTHVWHWRKFPIGVSRKGQLCRLLAVGRMNSAMVEFEDGARFITNRRGLRRIR